AARRRDDAPRQPRTVESAPAAAPTMLEDPDATRSSRQQLRDQPGIAGRCAPHRGHRLPGQLAQLPDLVRARQQIAHQAQQSDRILYLQTAPPDQYLHAVLEVLHAWPEQHRLSACRRLEDVLPAAPSEAAA